MRPGNDFRKKHLILLANLGLPSKFTSSTYKATRGAIVM